MPSSLILVAGHAAFRGSAPSDLLSDEGWVLAPFQRGEPRFYLEHIRRGVELTRADAEARLVFSGGCTHRESGEWSEATSYLTAARQEGWIGDGGLPEERVLVEEHARDSFENLLFALCRFHDARQEWPGRVTVVSWGFKQARFEHHAATLRLGSRFHFVGPNDPEDVESARRNEQATLDAFRRSPLGLVPDLRAKRQARDPFDRDHPYRGTPGLSALFAALDGEDESPPAPGPLPWED